MVNSHQMMFITIDKHEEHWTVTITTNNTARLPLVCDTYEEVERVVKAAVAGNHPNQMKIEDYEVGQ